MARVYKRDGSWHYYFERRGRRYRESAGRIGPITRDMARRRMDQRIREIVNAEIDGPKPERISFAAFADDFLATENHSGRTRERGGGIIGMLKVQWKGMNLDAISPKLIEDYKVKRIKVRSPATVYKELQIVKRLFKKSVEWGRLQTNPAATVKRPRVNNLRVRFLNADEMARLMRAAKPWLRPYIIFAHFTGARRGEMLRLIWIDVDSKRGRLIFRDTKNGEDAEVAINDTVRRLLESLPQPIDRSQKVFAIENNDAGWKKIKRAWTAACSAAKITGFRWHDLRHQAATDLLERGANLNDVRDFLRHKSMNMTLRYAHLIDSRREHTARLLDAPSRSTGTTTGEESKS